MKPGRQSFDACSHNTSPKADETTECERRYREVAAISLTVHCPKDCSKMILDRCSLEQQHKVIFMPILSFLIKV